jgi:hypothetical protein
MVALLAGQGLGLGLNLGVAPSSTLLPAEAVTWLAAMAAGAPSEAAGHLRGFAPSREVPQGVIDALGTKLAAMAAMIGQAHLVSARHDDGTESALLALVGVPEGRQADVAAAVAEAVRFSGAAGWRLDVVFPSQGGAAAQAVARVGWRFELPRPAETRAGNRAGPGTDPDRPPILR